MKLDAYIAIGIAFLTAVSLGLAQEDSYKYVDPVVRFWLVLGTGAVVQGLHALSKFRDGTFQKYVENLRRQAEANKTGVASVVTDTVEPKP